MVHTDHTQGFDTIHIYSKTDSKSDSDSEAMSDDDDPNFTLKNRVQGLDSEDQ